MALAAELCERALFTFGRVTTSSFRQNIEQGRARLDFRRPENRQFWLAGYHYLKSLLRKGTYRTALEWAKLLYSLNLSDPYAMRHYIHFLAIRAYESSWLVGFLAELGRDGEGRGVAYLQQSLVLARLQLNQDKEARECLVEGMQQLPWLYCALFQELNLDAPPSIWGINADSNARSFWVKLYLHQTKDLWNNAKAIALLQDAAKSLSRVDVASLPADDAPVDLGSTRLVYLEGQTSLLAVAPPDLLDSQPNYEFDPLPPPEEENIFTGQGTQLPWKNRQSQSQAGEGDVLAQMQHFLAQRGGGGGPAGVGLGGGVAGDEEIQGLDGLDTDDEELQRDIAAQMGEGAGPGLLATLMQMLGVGGGGGGGGVRDDDGQAAGDGNDDGDGDGRHTEEADGLPGSWPAGEDDARERGA